MANELDDAPDKSDGDATNAGNGPGKDNDSPDKQEGPKDPDHEFGPALREPAFGSSFRESQPARDFGFPELRDFANSGRDRDDNLRASKDFALGTWELVTGQEPSVAGMLGFKEIGIGVVVAAGAFLFGPVAIEGEMILGTSALPGIEIFTKQLTSAIALGSAVSEALGFIGKAETRGEGLEKMNEAGHELQSARSTPDHIPGESRSTDKDRKQ